MFLNSGVLQERQFNAVDTQVLHLKLHSLHKY
jgi:hypothetical protein